MQTIMVPEIEVGRRFVGDIAWDVSTAVGLEDLPANVKIVGQFRLGPGEALIQTVTTDNGSIIRTGPRGIGIRLTAAQTEPFREAAVRGYAWIDFIRFDTPTDPIGIPFSIKWPVTVPITVL